MRTALFLSLLIATVVPSALAYAAPAAPTNLRLIGIATPTSTPVPATPTPGPTPTPTPTSTATPRPTGTPLPPGVILNPYFKSTSWVVWGEGTTSATYNGQTNTLPAPAGSRKYPVNTMPPYPGNFLETSLTPNNFSGYWNDAYSTNDGGHSNLPNGWSSGGAEVSFGDQALKLSVYGGAAQRAYGVNFTSQSTTCMGHDRVVSSWIPLDEKDYFFSDTLRSGPAFYSLRELLPDHPIDSYKTIPEAGFHSLGRSSSEVNGIAKMLIAGANMPAATKKLLKTHGLYPAALLYLWKRSLPYANADGSQIDYLSEILHRPAYLTNGNEFSEEFMFYNAYYHKYDEREHLRRMVETARSMNFAPPLTILTLIKGTRVKNGVTTTWTTDGETYPTTINALLDQGSTVTLDIDLSKSIDLQGIPLTFEVKKLYENQRNVTISKLSDTQYRISATYDSGLPKFRATVIVTASNGYFQSNPAVISFYALSSVNLCTYQNGSDPNNEENINKRPVFNTRDGNAIYTKPGQTVAASFSCTDPEGFPTKLYRWADEKGSLSGAGNFQWAVPASQRAALYPVHLLCTDGTGGNAGTLSNIVVERSDVALPSGWHATDIGLAEIGGQTTASGDQFTLTATGVPGVRYDRETAQVAFQQAGEEIDFGIKLLEYTSSNSNNARFGIQLSENLELGSPYGLFNFFTGGSNRFVDARAYNYQSWQPWTKRTAPGISSSIDRIRIVQNNKHAASYVSSDGTTWQELFWSDMTARATQFYAGIFLAPYDTNAGNIRGRAQLLPAPSVALPVLRVSGSRSGESYEGEPIFKVQDPGPSVTIEAFGPSGSDVYYSINGGDPTTSSSKYTTGIQLTNAGTYVIRARSFKGSQKSDLMTLTFTIAP